MMDGRNCADKADFATVMKTIAHDMNLFRLTKSMAGHDCVTSTGSTAPARISSCINEYVPYPRPAANVDQCAARAALKGFGRIEQRIGIFVIVVCNVLNINKLIPKNSIW